MNRLTCGFIVLLVPVVLLGANLKLAPHVGQRGADLIVSLVTLAGLGYVLRNPIMMVLHLSFTILIAPLIIYRRLVGPGLAYQICKECGLRNAGESKS